MALQFNIPERNEIPVSELFRRFGQDASALMKSEIALAKLELRDSVKHYAKDAASLGIAAGLALVGALALGAFAIIGLGDLIDNYWLSALIVAVALLATAAVLAKDALSDMKENRLAPEETLRTLRQDQRWAKREANEFKQHIRA